MVRSCEWIWLFLVWVFIYTITVLHTYNLITNPLITLFSFGHRSTVMLFQDFTDTSKSRILPKPRNMRKSWELRLVKNALLCAHIIIHSVVTTGSVNMFSWLIQFAEPNAFFFATQIAKLVNNADPVGPFFMVSAQSQITITSWTCFSYLANFWCTEISLLDSLHNDIVWSKLHAGPIYNPCGCVCCTVVSSSAARLDTI